MLRVLGAGGVIWLLIIRLLALEAPKDINTSTGTGLKRQGARVPCCPCAHPFLLVAGTAEFLSFCQNEQNWIWLPTPLSKKSSVLPSPYCPEANIIFFLPKTKAHFSRLAVSLTFSFRDNAELLLGTSGYDGVILRWSTGAKEIKVCCGNLHAKHPGIFPSLSENITRKSSIVSEWCALYAVAKSSYEMLFSFSKLFHESMLVLVFEMLPIQIDWHGRTVDLDLLPTGKKPPPH